MSILEVARADLMSIITDASGASSECALTDPDGFSVDVRGVANDIHRLIDAGTGEEFTGRQASVTFSSADLLAKGFSSLPAGQSNAASKPWVVTFGDYAGGSHSFKVSQSWPDNTLGVVVCILEVYSR